MAADPIIKGHPTVELYHGEQQPPTLITVCASCESMRSILFLSNGHTRDRWFCNVCRAEGDARPKMFPIS
jgi:hypothetical protein